MMKKFIYTIVGIILVIMGKILLQADLIPFLKWWAVVFAIGIIFMPLTSKVFTAFHDKGYLFSKTIGIAITGYLMWLISSIRLMKFTETNCIIMVAICLLLNAGIYFLLSKNSKKNQDSATAPQISGETVNKEDAQDYKSIFSLKDWKEGNFDSIILEELLFFTVFLVFTYIRCFKPEAYGTEKFMDYGFMTTMMRTDYLPPQDLWFSGTNLNYYYVGQYMAVFLTKLSFVEISKAYNLMLMMVGAFSFVLPFSLIYNVTAQYRNNQIKKYRFLPVISGLIAGTGVCMAGNMHYPTFMWFENAIRRFFSMEENITGYWFPDATRFIGYNPDTADKTIHEFPAYSFVLGDLHAHVVNIMFVLTVLGILFAWMCTRKAAKENNPTWWKEIINPTIILITFFIGLFHTTNFWDFPIYVVVAGAIILFSNFVVYHFSAKAIWLTALQGAFVFGVSEVVCLPFTLNFNQISTNIHIVEMNTPLNQLIILWGLPIITVVCFLGFVINDFRIKRSDDTRVNPKKQDNFITHFLDTLNVSDLFILTIGLCAIGLILIPEIVYVQDIYSGDYKRANTMFKLTYQAFIMFGICFGYIFTRLLCYGKTKRQKWVAGIELLFFVLTVCYIQNAVNAWYGNIFDRTGYETLDCTAFMETTMPEDDKAIDWLNENVTGTPVVLEANGDSYTDYERVSVMTGLPTILGWRTHEWLWKSDTDILDERAADIATIYTSQDITAVKELLKEYNV
ncbi:MAG: DUF2298 domain-containing protein, partial [Mobilitalea sp.]